MASLEISLTFAQDVLPTAPQVVGGSANVSQSGAHQTVTQTTDKAIINWGSFSIGPNNSVQFVQPGSSSVILNRVIGSDPSSIFGSMSANGQVFLVNPNGVFFGVGSSIDVGGLVATTMSISDADFLSGYFNFQRSGAGQVENAGIITIRDGGYALLAADKVVNTSAGKIIAPNGNVTLASADRVTIETQSDGLVGFSVKGETLRQVASVENAGYIAADGGRIVMSARGTRELTGMVVNNTGVLQARGIEEKGGEIVLTASSGTTKSSGMLDASGNRGGSVQVTNEQGQAIVSGTVNASGSAAQGGSIVVVGKQTGVFSDTTLDASGTTCGSVRIGGDFRGAGAAGIVSDKTYVAETAAIKADGSVGDGGSVVVWANDSTRYDGSISARGGISGKGGDAEVSGKQSLAFNGAADLTSFSGRSGTLLLDPDKITITDQASGAAQDGELNDNQILAGELAGTESVISRGKLENLASNANVTLEATKLINIQPLTNSLLDMKQGAGNTFTMRVTNATALTDGINTNGNTIQTQGGNIVMRVDGGSGKIIANNVNAKGGDITITGQLETGGNNLVLATNNTGSIDINGNIDAGSKSVSITTSSGNIDVQAISAQGITLQNTAENITSTGALNAGSNTLTITATNGNIQSAALSGANVTLTANGAARTISTTGTVSSSGNVSISADGNITTTGSVSGNSGVTYNSSHGAISAAAVTSSGGNAAFTAAGNITTSGTVTGSTAVTYNSGGALNTANVSSGGTISYTSTSMQLGNADTTGNINISGVTTGNTVLQKSGTRLKANALTANVAGTGGNVDLRLNNEVNSFNATGNSYVGFKSINNLSVGTVTTNNTAGSSMDVSSSGKLTVTGPVTASADATHGAQIALTGGNGVAINGNVTATGGGTFNQHAAAVTIRATGGAVTQNTGVTVQAIDNSAMQVDGSQLAHDATVTVQADNGSVQVANVKAQSNGGRAQVDLLAKGNVTVSSGATVQSIAAAQPGVRVRANLNDGSGSVDTRGATISTTQLAERQVTTNGATTYTYINKSPDAETVPEGILVEGNNITLGRITTGSTAPSGTALSGVTVRSTGNVTFTRLVDTNSEDGIVVSMANDSLVQTDNSNGNSGQLQAKTLALRAEKDKGVFRGLDSSGNVVGLKTDVSNLTVLGGKGIDIDNTVHSGTLNISALGRISSATTDPNSGLEIPAVDAPVGGLRIKSKAINLLSLDNRSNGNYDYTGASKSRQDLALIADTIDSLPGTIATKATTTVHLMPLTSNQDISIVYSALGSPSSNTTYYTAGPTGLLNQFNPDSILYIGDKNMAGSSDLYGYTGNINIATQGTTSSQQISLGKMELHFSTVGRIYNGYATDPDTPSNWNETGGAPYSVTLPCVGQVVCLSAMTNNKIYFQDSLQPSGLSKRNIVITGTGNGTGGTNPPANGDTNNSGTGGGDSGSGSSGGGGGGGGSNDNDSQPGGSNAPSNDPGGGGSSSSPTGTGTTSAVNNPQQGTGNPGGNPNTPTDPANPGNGSLSGDSGTGSSGSGDGIAGGGEFSSGGSTGNTGGQTGGGSTSSGNTGGGSNGNNNGGQTGGGSLSDGSAPGDSNGGTQSGSGSSSDGSSSGGSSSSGSTGGGSNGSNNGGQTGGGSLSDGSSTGNTGGGSQSGGSNAGNNGGFSGGGSNGGDAGGTSGGTGSGGSTGGGSFSDGSGSGGFNPGNTGTGSGSNSGGSSSGTTGTGSTSSSSDGNGGVVSGGSVSTSGNNGGFSGGGSTGDDSSMPGGTGGSGGGSFSDGSNSGNGTSGSGSAGSASNAGSGAMGGSSSSSGGTQSDGSTSGNTGANGSSGNASGNGSGSSSAGNGTSGSSGANGSTSGGQSSSGGFSGGASSGSNLSPNDPGSGGSSGGGSFSDGSSAGGSTSGSSSGAVNSGTGSSNGYSGSGSNAGGSSGSSSSAGNAGSSSGSSGSSSTGVNYGGFSGGAGSGSDFGQGGSGSSGGAAFSDGSSSSSVSSGGSNGMNNSQPLGGNNSGSGQMNNGSGSNGGSSSGSSNSSTGADAQSGQSGNGNSSTGANSQGGSGNGNGSGNDKASENSLFSGGAGGGGSGDGSASGAESQQESSIPECADESSTVKRVSRPGQPGADILNMKATGVRVRPNEGDLNAQRASCASSRAN